MTTSIRTFLLINLLLSVTLITSLTIIGNFFLAHKNLRAHLDAEVESTALTIQALINQDTSKQELYDIQKAINRIPLAINNKVMNEQRLQFQIWSHNNKLLLHSSHAPKKALNNAPNGFSDQIVGQTPWRIFRCYNKMTNTTVVVAERYEFRNHIMINITQGSILIMLVTYPFLGLLIWIIVGKALDGMSRVTKEVHKRAASHLKPVSPKVVPPEIKPLVIELNELFLRLQRSFQYERRFAADAAHELRTPLAALKAQAQVALNATNIEERNAALKKVLQGIDRSTHIVQQLLTLSRMVPETVLRKKEKVNLNEKATQVIADLVPQAQQKSINIELIAPKEKTIIMGNAIAITILINNLVDNAIRYTPEKGNVLVTIINTEQETILKVSDNGPGIPKELRQQVFERFFRIVGNNATGSGLGLGIVQQIVQIHRAKIELGTPKSGKGLEVTITFKK